MINSITGLIYYHSLSRSYHAIVRARLEMKYQIKNFII